MIICSQWLENVFSALMRWFRKKQKNQSDHKEEAERGQYMTCSCINMSSYIGMDIIRVSSAYVTALVTRRRGRNRLSVSAVVRERLGY